MNFDILSKIYACIFMLIGSAECFAGYKLSKSIPEIKGFFIGAMAGIAVGFYTGSPVIGAVLIFSIGCFFAFLSAISFYTGKIIVSAFTVWASVILVFHNFLIACIAGFVAGIATLFFTKHSVILATAFSGIGIVLASAYFLMDTDMASTFVLTLCLWIPVTGFGAVCQYITNPKSSETISGIAFSSKPKPKPAVANDSPYPGMQVAYRVFCINCGLRLPENKICPRCGFAIDR